MTRSGTALAAVTVGALLVTAVGTPALREPVAAAGSGQALHARIVIDATRLGPSARADLLGVNHHYSHNGGGLWDPVADRPEPAVVAGSRRAGIQNVRFPGGTVGNLYDWKRAIGDDRGCQISSPEHGLRPVPGAKAFGPDEYMEFLDAIDARPLIMMPWATESPGDAADWVEYMNAPANVAGNPNGGVDWADVRAANGHVKPYGVRRWEVANEPNHGDQQYWTAERDSIAVRQYAFGGGADIDDESLGRGCRFPVRGVPSNGEADQVFSVLYPPVRRRSVVVTVGQDVWRQVDNLEGAAPEDQVYVLRPVEGDVVFGDGTHGAIPPRGVAVRATYRSTHAGFFEFARAMRAVDPSIMVCPSWDKPAFLRVAAGRRLDCITSHPITSFRFGGKDDWDGPLEGHDLQVAAGERRVDAVDSLRKRLPQGTPLLLTEFTFINGDQGAFPRWQASMSHATAMASLWAAWLRRGIPWGMGDDLLWGFDRAVLGPAPDFTFTADAVTRQTILPMFQAGGRVVGSPVPVNPVRDAGWVGRYRALSVVATRASGHLWVLVVNRLPFESVSARVAVEGARLAGRAAVRRVRAPDFTSWNRPDAAPAVRMVVGARPVGARRFRHTFGPHSVTVLRMPLDR